MWRYMCHKDVSEVSVYVTDTCLVCHIHVTVQTCLMCYVYITETYLR